MRSGGVLASRVVANIGSHSLSFMRSHQLETPEIVKPSVSRRQVFVHHRRDPIGQLPEQLG
jgi:hypothetical protein